jgi:hypothetical protein
VGTSNRQGCQHRGEFPSRVRFLEIKLDKACKRVHYASMQEPQGHEKVKTREKANCLYCEVLFEKVRRHQRFCCPSHRFKYWRENSATASFSAGEVRWLKELYTKRDAVQELFDRGGL